MIFLIQLWGFVTVLISLIGFMYWTFDKIDYNEGSALRTTLARMIVLSWLWPIGAVYLIVTRIKPFILDVIGKRKSDG